MGEYFPFGKKRFRVVVIPRFPREISLLSSIRVRDGFYTGAHRVERRPRWQERYGFRLLDAFITPLVTSSGVGGTHDWIRSTLDSCYRVTPVEFSVRRRLVR